MFRFVSSLGERYTHGHVFDFYQKLLANPSKLEVLGDGKQRKSYLYVQDCIDAIMIAIERATDRVNIFNLGQDEYCEVNQSIGWICERLQLKPRLEYTGGERGWIAHNPFIFLHCHRYPPLRRTPKLSIHNYSTYTIPILFPN